METLTRVMARTVYGIDLQDPPLEKLTQRSKVKKFGRGKMIESSSFEVRQQSFSRGWSRVHGQIKTTQVANEDNSAKKPLVLQKPEKHPLPRSASEPGMRVGLGMHIKPQLSESAIDRPMHKSLSAELNHKNLNTDAQTSKEEDESPDVGKYEIQRTCYLEIINDYKTPR